MLYLAICKNKSKSKNWNIYFFYLRFHGKKLISYYLFIQYEELAKNYFQLIFYALTKI